MNKLFPYIYDFVSECLEDEYIQSEVYAMVLFGSAARNQARKDSDIDLFFEIKNTEKLRQTEKQIKKAIDRFELIAEKLWWLKGINNSFNVISGKLNDSRWKNLREDIISSGIVLFGKYRAEPKNRKNFALINYSIKNLKQKTKMSFLREFYGYQTKKGKKVYYREGFIRKIGGEKLGANAFMIPMDVWQDTKSLLSKHKVKYKIREALVHY